MYTIRFAGILVRALCATVLGTEEPEAPKPEAPKSAAKPSAPTRREDPGVKEDYEKIQGTFAHEVRDKEGRVRGRIVKYIKDRKEMIVHERADGVVTHAHRADIELGRMRGIRLFRHYNGEIIEGPQKGQKFADGVYIYRIDDRAFTEAFGFFAGQEKQAPVVRMYMRLKDDPAAEKEDN